MTLYFVRWPMEIEADIRDQHSICSHCEDDWVSPAVRRAIIDWSIEGKSIFDRKRPLSPKTLARIYAGAVKFRWPAPFLVILRNHMDAQSVDEPVPTLCAGGSHIGLVQPFLLNRHGENGSTRAHDLDEPMPTADCRGAGYLCEPFVANLAHAAAKRRSHRRSDPRTSGEQPVHQAAQLFQEGRSADGNTGRAAVRARRRGGGD